MACSGKSAPAMKNMKIKMQKLLVYEPIKDDLCPDPRSNVKRLPVPQGGKSIMLCESRQMKRACFPKLCSCPTKPLPLCPNERRIGQACLIVKIGALIMMLKLTHDAGFWSHPDKSRQLVKTLSQKLDISGQRKAEEEAKKPPPDPKDKKAEKPQQKQQEVEEYENEPFNILNIWNGLIIGFANSVINLGKKEH